MAPKPVIYVSSTFVDLEAHRAALKKALEKARYDVECMEKYPAFDERPLEKCLADVAAADGYVLLVAHRYGYRPEEDNPERKSITHLEYEEAGRHEGKPRLVFTVDPRHPWNPEWIDEGDDKRDLTSFRAQAQKRHGINPFTDPDQLDSLVLQALRAREESPGRPATKTWTPHRAGRLGHHPPGGGEVPVPGDPGGAGPQPACGSAGGSACRRQKAQAAAHAR